MRHAILIVSLGFVGCTFPDVNVAPLDGATADTGGPLRDADRDSGLGDAQPDTAIDDSATPSDVIVEVASDANPCDQDGDGFLNGKAGCSTPEVDCNDLTTEAHPGVKDFVHFGTGPAANWTTTPGDWNCDGTVDKELAREDCAGLATSCTGREGIAADPATIPCGAPVKRNKCGPSGLNCVVATASDYDMGCR